LYGAQISLLVGIVGAGVSLVIGVLWGAIAGYVGGRVDSALMRIVDVLYSLPTVIFVIVLITTLGEMLKQSHFIGSSPALAGALRVALLFVGLGAVSWLTMARIVRGQVLSLRTRAFVEASRALGGGPVRILARHIIPNVFGVVITYLALTVPAIILYESFPELPRPGRATADGELGHAHRGGRRPDQSHPDLLVADCLSRRRAGDDAAGAELSRRRPARRVGCERRGFSGFPVRRQRQSSRSAPMARWSGATRCQA
jgi:oligopeptide transport system permease protein